MRIAIFTKRTVFHDGFGGLETHTTVLAEELTKRGYSVVVFAPQYKLSYQSKVQNGVTYSFVPSVYRMLFKNSSDNWYSASQQAFKLEHANEKFALVISQSSAGVGIIDNRDYFKVPVLSIAHGSILSEYKTRLLSVASVKDTAYLLKDILFVLINYFGRQRAFILGSSHVVAVSNAVKNSLIDETFISEDNITVIHNGIDPSVFANITSKRDFVFDSCFYWAFRIRKRCTCIAKSFIRSAEFIC
ncbi:MAG: glycosyltransferase family 4 protein [Patescibacteria group bacterium]